MKEENWLANLDAVEIGFCQLKASLLITSAMFGGDNVFIAVRLSVGA